jgi:hypothetical protein
MEEIAAAEADAGFEEFDDFVKALRGEWRGVKQEQRDVSDDFAGAYASDHGVGFGGLQDLRGVVGKDETQKFGERSTIRGKVAEERGGAFTPDEDFRSGLGAEPILLAEYGEHIRPRKQTYRGLQSLGTFRFGHEGSLAQCVDTLMTARNA